MIAPVTATATVVAIAIETAAGTANVAGTTTVAVAVIKAIRELTTAPDAIGLRRLARVRCAPLAPTPRWAGV